MSDPGNFRGISYHRQYRQTCEKNDSKMISIKLQEKQRKNHILL